MKRRQLSKTDINNHNTSNTNASKGQDVLIGQIWINTEARDNGVKITELNSSYSSSDEHEEDRQDHSWSYIKNAANADDQLKQYSNRENNISYGEQGESSQKYDDITDYIFTNENNASIKKDLEKLIIRHEFRCLKMLQNHLVFGSDSSDDDYEEMLKLEDEYNKRQSYDERRSDENDYSPKDIWGYVRNNDVLAKNDFIFTDIPSKETKESLCNESTEVRLKTPPGNHCNPKLKFSLPMLPTVTEVSEPNKPVENKENDTNIFKGNVPITPKSVNSWVGSDELNTKNLITWRKISPKEQNPNMDSVNEINKHVSVPTKENENGETICIDSGNFEVTSQNEYEVEEKSDEQSNVEIYVDTNRTFESHKNNSPIDPDKLNLTFSYDSTDSNMFYANSKDNSQRKSGKNVADLGETTLLRYPSLDKSTQTCNLTYITVPPLHLSLLNSEKNQSTWFTRIFKCFCCCESKSRQ